MAAGGMTTGRLDEEILSGETAVPFAALCVEDPQLCPPPRRAKAVASHHHLRPLADHVAPEADPRPPGELEPQAGRLGHRLGRSCRQSGRPENDEQRLRAPGKRREAMETFRDSGPVPGSRTARWRALGWQVDQEDVDGSGLQQRSGHRQALVEVDRGEHDQPVELDSTSDGLDGIQASSEIHVADDAAGCLRLRGEPQRERRLAAGVVAQDGEARLPRHAAGAENRVERREPRSNDPGILEGLGQTGGRRERLGKRGQRADDRSGRAPALAK
jgi:hypothetical protein